MTLGHSGTSTYLMNLVPALIAVEPASTYLILWPGGAVSAAVAEWASERCQIIQLPSVSRLLWDYVVVPRALRRQRADVFHMPSGPGGLLLRRGGRPRVVVTLHDIIPLLFPGQYFRNPAHAAFYRMQLRLTARADDVIAVSESAGADILQRTPIVKSRLTVIHEALDKGFEGPAPGGGPVRQPFLLTLGGAEPRKNVTAVISAFARLSGTIPHRLVVVGGPWRGRDASSLAPAGPIREKIDFVGSVEAGQLHALYTTADVFVFASLYEGFGLPVLEAMASGTPVIASRAGSLPEVAGDAAVLINPSDPAEIAAAIAQVLADHGERARLIEAGHRRVALYSWRRAAAETLAVYNRVAT